MLSYFWRSRPVAAAGSITPESSGEAEKEKIFSSSKEGADCVPDSRKSLNQAHMTSASAATSEASTTTVTPPAEGSKQERKESEGVFGVVFLEDVSAATFTPAKIEVEKTNTICADGDQLAKGAKTEPQQPRQAGAAVVRGAVETVVLVKEELSGHLEIPKTENYTTTPCDSSADDPFGAAEEISAVPAVRQEELDEESLKVHNDSAQVASFSSHSTEPTRSTAGLTDENLQRPCAETEATTRTVTAARTEVSVSAENSSHCARPQGLASASVAVTEEILAIQETSRKSNSNSKFNSGNQNRERRSQDRLKNQTESKQPAHLLRDKSPAGPDLPQVRQEQEAFSQTHSTYEVESDWLALSTHPSPSSSQVHKPLRPPPQTPENRTAIPPAYTIKNAAATFSKITPSGATSKTATAWNGTKKLKSGRYLAASTDRNVWGVAYPAGSESEGSSGLSSSKEWGCVMSAGVHWQGEKTLFGGEKNGSGKAKAEQQQPRHHLWELRKGQETNANTREPFARSETEIRSELPVNSATTCSIKERRESSLNKSSCSKTSRSTVSPMGANDAERSETHILSDFAGAETFVPTSEGQEKPSLRVLAYNPWSNSSVRTSTQLISAAEPKRSRLAATPAASIDTSFLVPPAARPHQERHEVRNVGLDDFSSVSSVFSELLECGSTPEESSHSRKGSNLNASANALLRQMQNKLEKQCRRRLLGKKHRFNILITGDPNSGKSTLFRQMFSTWHCVSSRSVCCGEENLFQLGGAGKIPLFEVSVTETTNSLLAVPYCELLLLEYLEKKMQYGQCLDDRIHVVLYLLLPSDVGLHAKTLALLRKLAHLTCLFPVLSKCDTYPLKKVGNCRRMLHAQLFEAGITLPQQCLFGEIATKGFTKEDSGTASVQLVPSSVLLPARDGEKKKFRVSASFFLSAFEKVSRFFCLGGYGVGGSKWQTLSIGDGALALEPVPRVLLLKGFPYAEEAKTCQAPLRATSLLCGHSQRRTADKIQNDYGGELSTKACCCFSHFSWGRSSSTPNDDGLEEQKRAFTRESCCCLFHTKNNAAWNDTGGGGGFHHYCGGFSDNNDGGGDGDSGSGCSCCCHDDGVVIWPSSFRDKSFGAKMGSQRHFQVRSGGDVCEQVAMNAAGEVQTDSALWGSSACDSCFFEERAAADSSRIEEEDNLPVVDFLGGVFSSKDRGGEKAEEVDAFSPVWGGAKKNHESSSASDDSSSRFCVFHRNSFARGACVKSGDSTAAHKKEGFFSFLQRPFRHHGSVKHADAGSLHDKASLQNNISACPFFTASPPPLVSHHKKNHLQHHNDDFYHHKKNHLQNGDWVGTVFEKSCDDAPLSLRRFCPLFPRLFFSHSLNNKKTLRATHELPANTTTTTTTTITTPITALPVATTSTSNQSLCFWQSPTGPSIGWKGAITAVVNSNSSASSAGDGDNVAKEAAKASGSLVVVESAEGKIPEKIGDLNLVEVPAAALFSPTSTTTTKKHTTSTGSSSFYSTSSSHCGSCSSKSTSSNTSSNSISRSSSKSSCSSCCSSKSCCIKSSYDSSSSSSGSGIGVVGGIDEDGFCSCCRRKDNSSSSSSSSSGSSNNSSNNSGSCNNSSSSSYSSSSGGGIGVGGGSCDDDGFCSCCRRSDNSSSGSNSSSNNSGSCNSSSSNSSSCGSGIGISGGSCDDDGLCSCCRRTGNSSNGSNSSSGNSSGSGIGVVGGTDEDGFCSCCRRSDNSSSSNNSGSCSNSSSSNYSSSSGGGIGISGGSCDDDDFCSCCRRSGNNNSNSNSSSSSSSSSGGKDGVCGGVEVVNNDGDGGCGVGGKMESCGGRVAGRAGGVVEAASAYRANGGNNALGCGGGGGDDGSSNSRGSNSSRSSCSFSNDGDDDVGGGGLKELLRKQCRNQLLFLLAGPACRGGAAWAAAFRQTMAFLVGFAAAASSAESPAAVPCPTTHPQDASTAETQQGLQQKTEATTTLPQHPIPLVVEGPFDLQPHHGGKAVVVVHEEAKAQEAQSRPVYHQQQHFEKQTHSQEQHLRLPEQTQQPFEWYNNHHYSHHHEYQELQQQQQVVMGLLVGREDGQALLQTQKEQLKEKALLEKKEEEGRLLQRKNSSAERGRTGLEKEQQQQQLQQQGGRNTEEREDNNRHQLQADRPNKLLTQLAKATADQQQSKQTTKKEGLEQGQKQEDVEKEEEGEGEEVDRSREQRRSGSVQKVGVQVQQRRRRKKKKKKNEKEEWSGCDTLRSKREEGREVLWLRRGGEEDSGKPLGLGDERTKRGCCCCREKLPQRRHRHLFSRARSEGAEAQQLQHTYPDFCVHGVLRGGRDGSLSQQRREKRERMERQKHLGERPSSASLAKADKKAKVEEEETEKESQQLMRMRERKSAPEHFSFNASAAKVDGSRSVAQESTKLDRSFLKSLRQWRHVQSSSPPLSSQQQRAKDHRQQHQQEDEQVEEGEEQRFVVLRRPFDSRSSFSSTSRSNVSSQSGLNPTADSSSENPSRSDYSSCPRSRVAHRSSSCTHFSRSSGRCSRMRSTSNTTDNHSSSTRKRPDSTYGSLTSSRRLLSNTFVDKAGSKKDPLCSSRRRFQSSSEVGDSVEEDNSSSDNLLENGSDCAVLTESWESEQFINNSNNNKDTSMVSGKEAIASAAAETNALCSVENGEDSFYLLAAAADRARFNRSTSLRTTAAAPKTARRTAEAFSKFSSYKAHHQRKESSDQICSAQHHNHSLTATPTAAAPCNTRLAVEGERKQKLGEDRPYEAQQPEKTQQKQQGGVCDGKTKGAVASAGSSLNTVGESTGWVAAIRRSVLALPLLLDCSSNYEQQDKRYGYPRFESLPPCSPAFLRLLLVEGSAILLTDFAKEDCFNSFYRSFWRKEEAYRAKRAALCRWQQQHARALQQLHMLQLQQQRTIGFPTKTAAVVEGTVREGGQSSVVALNGSDVSSIECTAMDETSRMQRTRPPQQQEAAQQQLRDAAELQHQPLQRKRKPRILCEEEWLQQQQIAMIQQRLGCIQHEQREQQARALERQLLLETSQCVTRGFCSKVLHDELFCRRTVERCRNTSTRDELLGDVVLQVTQMGLVSAVMVCVGALIFNTVAKGAGSH